jgi:glycosyltransferase involved in cell wall biosynthesis
VRPQGRHRLGVYCPGNGTGGPWRYVHSVLAGLDPAEFDVTVFCDLSGEYDPQPWVNVVRIGGPAAHLGGATGPTTRLAPSARRPRFSRLTPKSLRLCAGFVKQTRRLARLIRQHQPDIFHTQNTGCEESPVAARWAGVPNVIGTFHVDSTYDLHNERSDLGHRAIEHLSNRCLHVGIAVSEATKRDWMRRTHVSDRRLMTIHNGIDPECFHRRKTREVARAELGLPARGLYVGGLGRLDEAKGFEYLLDAAQRLRGRFPDLLVVIAGDGPLRKSLEQKATLLGLADIVRFLGFQSDVQRVLDALDVFALPSLCEALPYAGLEAMATQLPVVGATVGGVAEMILEGDTGLLVPPRDADQLAAKLSVLLTDADLRVRMGVAGRERVLREFQESDMVRKTIDVYRKLLPKRFSRRFLVSHAG